MTTTDGDATVEGWVFRERLDHKIEISVPRLREESKETGVDLVRLLSGDQVLWSWALERPLAGLEGAQTVRRAGVAGVRRTPGRDAHVQGAHGCDAERPSVGLRVGLYAA